MSVIRDNCTVLAFTGTLGSGKDYLAAMAQRHVYHDQIVQNVSFADLLKVNAMFLGGEVNPPLGAVESSLEMVENRYTEFFSTKPQDVRRHIQNYGESLRSRNPKIWVHGLYTHMLHQHKVNGVTVFLISDLRFPKEAEFVKEIGGTVVKVHAPERSAGTHVASGYTDIAVRGHVSETFVDTIDADYTIDNDNSNNDELIAQLKAITGAANTPATFARLQDAYQVHRTCG